MRIGWRISGGWAGLGADLGDNPWSVFVVQLDASGHLQ